MKSHRVTNDMSRYQQLYQQQPHPVAKAVLRFPIEPEIPCLKKAQSTSVSSQPHRRIVSFSKHSDTNLHQQSSQGTLKKPAVIMVAKNSNAVASEHQDQRQNNQIFVTKKNKHLNVAVAKEEENDVFVKIQSSCPVSRFSSRNNSIASGINYLGGAGHKRCETMVGTINLAD